MPPVFSYTEQLADTSPASASFTARSGSASAPYLTLPFKFADLPNRLIDVLGYTGTKPLTGDTAGKINRVLPLRHPQWQWLFADSFRPRGTGTTSTVITPSAGPTGTGIIPQFPLYANYLCDIAFSQRDYNVWQDADIKVVAATGYDKYGASYSYSYATEWLRFCRFELYPLNNFLDAKQGQMRFRAFGTGGAWNSTASVPGPDGTQYQDAPRMYLPDSALKVRWFGVPYRYLTSPKSYLRNFIGHVNQVAWGDVPASGNNFGPYQPGSLLYHGAKPTTIYQNVVPDEGLLAFNNGNGFARAMLCDLELDFTFTARQFDPYAVANGYVPDFSGTNKNWIVAGHNLLPWLRTRSFIYATSEGTPITEQAQWVPSFYSFPFSLFFTDPDVATSPTFTAGTAPIGP